MNSCSDFREEMLSAELGELRGEGDSALARHVQSCVACQAQAARLLGGHADIDRGLRAISQQHKPNPLMLRHPRRLWAALPLSAAAVLAWLLLAPDPQSAPRVDMIASLMLPEAPIVTTRSGQQAVLFERADMTIVWLYNQETL